MQVPIQIRQDPLEIAFSISASQLGYTTEYEYLCNSSCSPHTTLRCYNVTALRELGRDDRVDKQWNNKARIKPHTKNDSIV